MAFTEELLSGSSGGLGIKIAATSTAGTTIHTTGTSSSIKDEIYLYAVNSDTADRKLTIEFGGVASPDNLIELTIPAESGLVPVVQGQPITGTGSAGRTIGAFCASANVVMVYGWVQRNTPSTP